VGERLAVKDSGSENSFRRRRSLRRQPPGRAWSPPAGACPAGATDESSAPAARTVASACFGRRAKAPPPSGVPGSELRPASSARHRLRTWTRLRSGARPEASVVVAGAAVSRRRDPRDLPRGRTPQGGPRLQEQDATSSPLTCLLDGCRGAIRAGRDADPVMSTHQDEMARRRAARACSGVEASYVRSLMTESQDRVRPGGAERLAVTVRLPATIVELRRMAHPPRSQHQSALYGQARGPRDPARRHAEPLPA